MTLAQLVPLNLAQLVTFKNPKLGPVNNFTACIYICIYIYAVKLKAGPRLPFYKLKTGPSFFFVFLFFIFKNLILPAARRGILKNKQKQPKKHIFIS